MKNPTESNQTFDEELASHAAKLDDNEVFKQFKELNKLYTHTYLCNLSRRSFNVQSNI